MSSESGVDWSAVASARRAWRAADAQVPRLRAVHGDLSTLHDAVTRNKPDRVDSGTALAELDRLGGDSDDRREALGFLAEPLFEGERALVAAFRHGRAVTTEADAVATALSDYVDGGDWAPVRAAVANVIDPPKGPMAIDSTALEQVVTLFGLAIEAGIEARKRSANDLSKALAEVYTGDGDTYATLEEQPIAMLPVRLETRFVDEDRTTEGEPSDLLVRVFPDQIHIDSHEAELTDDEVHWGQNFWATLWYARHPDPSKVPGDPEATYLTDRLPNQRLRELVADIDPASFSTQHHKRYRELKERAWKQLLDRFGRERAAYVVHALEPGDGDLATELLTAPDPPPEPELEAPDLTVETPVVTQVPGSDGSSESGDGEGSGPAVNVPDDVTLDDDIEEQLTTDDAVGVDTGTELPDLDVQPTGESDGQSGTREQSDGESTAGANDSETASDSLPELTFPQVPRRPASWTQQARAELLPDRWVAVAEWEDATGESHRTAVAGSPIREPLPVGPSPESVAADETTQSETDSPAPEGTEWMVDFDEATAVGMGLRLNLSGLAGFDPSSGFTRLLVVGVKASLDADETPDALVDLLDAHHYTDGLELLEQGTPTNNYDDASGYTRSDDPLQSMAVECVPPLVESGDRSDGDILARALAIDSDDHVFANVENADSTQQRDARHMNSALWPATLGYFSQDLLLHNKFTSNDSIRGGTSDRLTGKRRRDGLSRPLLWHDAYRRHFVRYVRGQGPFPAMRVEKQPYGILPSKAIELDLDVTVVDHMQLAQLERGEIQIADLDGTETADLVDAGVSPQTVIEGGASPEEVLDAGADPTKVVAGAVDAAKHIDPRDVFPDAFTQDGIGLLATSDLTRSKLQAAGVPVEELEEMGVTVRAVARGEVTQEQLSEAGVTTAGIAEVVLPDGAKSLGITPRALERAGVTPAALLRGEISKSQIQALGLSTRAVADVILPREARELGITPKKLADAGISPEDLVNGTVAASDLETAGISTEAVAEALLPEELKAFGVTPEQVGDAVPVEDLFNGAVGIQDLQAAGLTTGTLADALLPEAVRDVGITPDSLEQAGITIDAVLNGEVTPEDIAEAGVTPEALAEADVLPDVLAEVGHAVSDLVDAGLQPVELLDQGLSPESLVDAGLKPGLLVDAGLAPKRLVDAGVDAVELVAKGGAPVKELVNADVAPSRLARLGATVSELTGGDVPAQEIVKAGFTAVDALEAGADAVGVAEGGARPTELADAGVDAGTLQEAGKAAGSLQLAGYSAAELLDAGYTAAELLNGGFSPGELREAGVDPSEVGGAGRAVEDLLAAGHPPTELKQNGYSARQLLDAGLDAAQLAESGYTAGELVDAGVPAEELAAAGVDVGELRAAGASVSDLAGADVDPQSLRRAGASAEELLEHGFDPQELVDAGFESVELELAGVDVDELAEDAVEGDATVDDGARSALDGLQYAATVLEDPEQAESDLYSFSFDPAVPKLPAGESTGSAGDGSGSEASQTDGGVAAGVPVVRPLAIDDQLPADLGARISGLATHWDEAAQELPFAGNTDEGGLLNVLKREGLSADIRQQTMTYSGEQTSRDDPLNQLVRGNFAPEATREQLVEDLSAGGDLDPRIGHLHTTDATDGALAAQRNPRGHFHQFHLNYPKRGSIKPHEMVDGNVDAFIEALLGSTLSDAEALSHRIDPDGLSLDTSLLANTDWTSLDAGEKRGRIVNAIEDADDPARFARRLVGGSPGDAAGYDKILQLGNNQAKYGDSGALRSLLRLLLQHSLLQEYVSARRRLGVAYDDLPDGWPDPAYYDSDTRGPLSSLYDPSPAALSSHPNVGGMDSDVGTSAATRYTYADALQDAAAEYTSTTSIDPRLSEFTDSLRHLQSVDPSDLSRLARQTLDLASHRLDAWWTSLATKRLFELREAQGTYDSEAGFDHEKWSGGGSDVPRATVDPSLLDSMETDTISAGTLETSTEDTGRQSSTDVSTSDVETGTDTAGGRSPIDTGPSETGDGSSITGEGSSVTTNESDIVPYDPANIADVDVSTGIDELEVDSSATDGGTDSNVGDRTALPAESIATRSGDTAPERLHDRVQSDPGLYVGGYGFVENLAVDENAEHPEFIHTPSQGHARTAAILRSGAESNDADEGENPLAVDISADRVRQGIRLIHGVQRGQSLGGLLGYRFERRLHEATVATDHGETDAEAHEINLMEYLDDFRAEFPAEHGKLKRPDEREDESRSERERDLAARESVDGFQLVKQWGAYPFGVDEFPGTDTTEYRILDDIVSDLEDDIDAAGDLLTAESVHQLGQGNFERTGGSIGALARGEPLPDPDVVRTPRSETGLTHRQCVLFGTAAADTDATPRTAAEPVLAAWVESLLPAGDDVSCLATYRWTETEPDPATGREQEIERTAKTSVHLADLDLGPLDVLSLFGAEREEARSELEQRLVYWLLRTRPTDPPVPADATVELELTETAATGSTSVADLLELARSIREMVQSSRPLTAEDLAHPADRRNEGYDESTVGTLTARANSAQDRLLEIARSVDERVAVLDAGHSASKDLRSSGDGGPAQDSQSVEAPTLTEQVTSLAESVQTADDELPLSRAESVANTVDASAIRSELSTLVETLPVGRADPDLATEDITVLSGSAQTVTGMLGEPVSVPDIPADGGAGEGAGDGSDGGQSVESAPMAVVPAQTQLNNSALGTTTEPETTVQMDDRPEVEMADEQWYRTQVEVPEQDAFRQPDAETVPDESDSGQGSGEEPTDQAPDWSTETATIRAWGTDGLSYFELTETTTPAADGSFSVDLDFSDVTPGTPFQVVGIVEGTIAYSATGRVVSDGGVSTTTKSTVENDCTTLKQLLWLQDHRELFAVESGPSAALELALDGMDWDAARAERNGIDVASSTVTKSDLDAVDALLDIEGLDPSTLADSVGQTAAPVSRLGLKRVIDITGGDGLPADLDYWFVQTEGVGDVRARIHRTLENPAPFNAGVSDRLLAYDHGAAATLHELDGGEAAAAYLDAFLAGPAWTARYLDRKLSEPTALIRGLTAWLYSPEHLSDTGALAATLRELASSVADLPALAALFEGLPTGGSDTVLKAFEGHLRSLAATLDDGTPAVGDAEQAKSVFETNSRQAATTLANAARAERKALSPVPAGVEKSFRNIVLERLREPMTAAASYGVYGGTPTSPDGGREEDESKLLEQARALLEKLRTRLIEATALDPRAEQTLADRPVPQRVEDATDRLETLFGDGFTVLPPFTPTNQQELSATFTDDGLVPDDHGMAAETWLQRAASFRDGVAEFREARSYAEAISGTLTPSLTVGQVPYEEGDTWVGVEGVQPTPGRLSLVAQFGPGVSPGIADGRMTGLFIDEWTEGVPEDTETTGVALNYDDPGNRAPQSVLLATPDGESWSLDELVSVVAETAEYTKRRAVDLGDLDAPTRLFPGLYFAQQNDPEPSTPTVDFRMLDWYDRVLLPEYQVLVEGIGTVETDGNDDGNGNGGGS